MQDVKYNSMGSQTVCNLVFFSDSVFIVCDRLRLDWFFRVVDFRVLQII